jgi:hypothetical protein
VSISIIRTYSLQINTSTSFYIHRCLRSDTATRLAKLHVIAKVEQGNIAPVRVFCVLSIELEKPASAARVTAHLPNLIMHGGSTPLLPIIHWYALLARLFAASESDEMHSRPTNGMYVGGYKVLKITLSSSNECFIYVLLLELV